MAIKAKEKEIGSSKTMLALSFWHGVTATALQKMPVDLSSRQTAILLHIYLMPSPHSIKKLAEEIPISKPAICRAVDTLENAKLVRRIRDKNDKRNVSIQRTVKGSVYLSEFADIILSMSKDNG
jgi:DNA-binding MarR family transcriptional regulator